MLSTESLNSRIMLKVSVLLESGVLTIQGDSWNNSAVVTESSELVENKNSVQVHVSSTPRRGFVLTPVEVDGTYTGVSAIQFFGRNGDDQFIFNGFIPCNAWGGRGNDILQGGSWSDNLYGENGDDVLRGMGGWGDNLYGGPNDDLLYGGEGLDGLFGGTGNNQLYGGEGNDRFLVLKDKQTEIRDMSENEASLTFENGKRKWDQNEIEFVDTGLRMLHLRTGNDNLLESASAGALKFVRMSKGSTSNTLAANFGDGERIEFYSSVFRSFRRPAELAQRMARIALTAVHEIAHNWDQVGNQNFDPWLTYSGWRNTDPDDSSIFNPATANGDKDTPKSDYWWYLRSASFVRDYGRTNPREDFATSWEAYFRERPWYVVNDTVFSGANPEGLETLSSGKNNYLDYFFNFLSG